MTESVTYLWQKGVNVAPGMTLRKLGHGTDASQVNDAIAAAATFTLQRAIAGKTSLPLCSHHSPTLPCSATIGIPVLPLKELVLPLGHGRVQLRR